MKMVKRYTTLHLAPEGKPMFSEESFEIAITDEGGGEFVVVRQKDDLIRIDVHEWPHLKDAIEIMIVACRS